MLDLIRELTLAWRALLKRPGLTLIAIASIALGMAVNSTVFAWIQRVLVTPVPGIASGNQIVSIKTVEPNGDWIDSSYLDARDIGRMCPSFSGVVAFRMQPLYLGDGEQQQRVWSQTVSGNFFDVLGVKPILGRTFQGEEQQDRPGGAPVVLVSEAFWRQHLNGDSGAIGRTIKLNRQTLTVIGVLPAEFEGAVTGLRFDLYVPLNMTSVLTGSRDWVQYRDSRPLMILGRLAAGRSLQQANAELKSAGATLASMFPDSNRKLSFTAMAVSDSPDGVQRVLKSLLRVLLAVGFAVLLIVLANVGNLLLARTLDRRRDFSIRLSLGARRSHLLAQLFAESAILTVLGVGSGVLASTWFSGVIDTFLPPTDLPITKLAGSLGLEGAAYTALLSVLVVAFCALAPALPVLRGQGVSLTENSRTVSSSSRTRKVRDGLVIAEISLATLALIGCGLFLRSFNNARTANPGFDPQGVLLAGVDLSHSGYSRDDGRAAIRRLLDALARTPGIRGVAFAEDVPLGFSGGSWEEVQVDGYQPATGESMKLWRDVVTPGYFEAMKIPLLAGRDFDDRDRREVPSVAIVNETFTRRYFQGASPVGRKFRGWGREITIVGMARDSRIHSLSEAPLPYFYVPMDQFYSPSMGFGIIARTQGSPEKFEHALRSAVNRTDPGMAITATATLVDFMGAAYFTQKVGANLLAVLGGLALILALVGLYGVMLYSITSRTREIGIRIAIGAQPGQVLGQVLREGFLLSIAGVGCGVALALVLGRSLSTLLYGVGAFDLPSFGAAASILLAGGVACAAIPARKAAGTDPMTALRWE